ncbi:MAG: methionyl-tRNA formyltransferase [FCB group bacterium]|nr:methionyl-tRNA formyltransferase [FCB group bacterium]
MKIVFMGNPDFAVPSLNKLALSHHDIIGVVSNPERRMGRGRQLQLTAVGDEARRLGLPLYPVDNLKSDETRRILGELKPDLFVVVAYRILPKSLLTLPRFGAVNLHASLLPRYRGAAPIQWSLINGDAETGITTFLIQPKVDVGQILLQKSTPIYPDDDAGTLSERLSVIGADLLVETVDGLERHTIEPREQDHRLATPAPKIHSEMTRIRWEQPAELIHGWVRALSPSPRAYTLCRGKRLCIVKSTPHARSDSALPGTVVEVSKRHCLVQTGDGLLEILSVHPEGKRVMDFVSFQAGAKLTAGERLGS